MSSSLSEELIAIRMELKGVREAVSGLHSVDKAQKGVATSTSATGVAAEKAEKKTSRLSRAFGALGKAAKYGLGFLGVTGVLALHTAVANTEELSKTTVGLTRNFDFQNNVASRWAAIAHARDIDSKALGMTFGTLSTKLTNAAREGGKALLPFHQLGLTQEDAAKGAHHFEWGVMRVAKALGEEEGGAKRAAAAKSLLGKGYATLLPLFSEGTKGLKEQLHWADEYGVTLNGHTNEAIMDMVSAQRESKVAMLGLQIAMTKALMPAIEGGEHELQKFIKTLTDPKLTDDRKFHRIEQQFLGLEDTLIQIVSDALPRVAEHGGELGVKLAGAVWSGFIHSDTLGKLVIGAWLFRAMGGFSLIGTLGARVGGKLATSLGWKFLATVAPYFAAEAGVEGLGAALGSQMGGLKTVFGRYGKALGTTMGIAAAGALVAEIVFAIEDSENIAGLSLLNTPKADATTREEEALRLREAGYTGIGFLPNGGLAATTPSGKHIVETSKGGPWTRHPAGGGHDSSHHRRGASHRLSRLTQTAPIETPKLSRLAFSGAAGRPIIIHIHHKTELDGKTVAENTAKHVAAAEALG